MGFWREFLDEVFGLGPSTAKPGSWYITYYQQWLNAHHPGAWEANRVERQPGDPECGCWAGGKWATGTPEWDRQWFRAAGMGAPTMIDRSQTHWKDYGGGLHRLES